VLPKDEDVAAYKGIPFLLKLIRRKRRHNNIIKVMELVKVIEVMELVKLKVLFGVFG